MYVITHSSTFSEPQSGKMVERNSNRIIARLLRDGWEEAGGKGSHRKFKHPVTGRSIVVPLPKKICRLARPVTSQSMLGGTRNSNPMQVYYAIVHKDPDSAFGISFPDLPGCFSAADEEDDVLQCAQEALALFAGDLSDLPTARSFQSLNKDEDVRRDLKDGAFVIAVPYIAVERKERFNLMLDSALVSGVDTVARAAGVSRSEFVSQTLKQRLRTETGAVIGVKSVVRSKTATKAEKPVAASALTQKGSNEQTSAKAASSAGKLLNSKTASKEAKSAAASALAQKTKAKKA